MTDFNVEIYDTVSKVNKNQWNNLVEQSKLGSFFHRYEWLKSIEEGIGLKPKHIVVSKDNNLIGFLPNFIDKIQKTPFKQLISISPGFGGPIISKHENEVLDLIFKEISKICGINIICHFISTLDLGYTRYSEYFEKKGYSSKLGTCRFIIDLNKNIEDLISEMDKGRRKNIKKDMSNDFVIRDEKINDDSLKNFHRIYFDTMKRIGGTAYPLKFFICLRNNLHERIKIFSAFVDGNEVGKKLYFLDEEQSSLHAFFSAIEKRAFLYNVSELLHVYAIKWGKAHNYQTYDFGSSRTNYNLGAFRFKEEFGGQIVPNLSWEKGHSFFGWNLFRATKYLYQQFK